VDWPRSLYHGLPICTTCAASSRTTPSTRICRGTTTHPAPCFLRRLRAFGDHEQHRCPTTTTRPPRGGALVWQVAVHLGFLFLTVSLSVPAVLVCCLLSHVSYNLFLACRVIYLSFSRQNIYSVSQECRSERASRKTHEICSGRVGHLAAVALSNRVS